MLFQKRVVCSKLDIYIFLLHLSAWLYQGQVLNIEPNQIEGFRFMVLNATSNNIPVI